MQSTDAGQSKDVPASGPTAVASSSTADAEPILQRMKELNDANLEKEKLIERLSNELKNKDERVKHLSADKRKEMEEFMKQVVDSWLGSLEQVNEETRAKFRNGLGEVAANADARNPAWEIVCNASIAHQSNVKKIEGYINEIAEKDRIISDLRGFKSAAARMTDPAIPAGAGQLPSHGGGGMTAGMSAGGGFKRQRVDDEGRNSNAAAAAACYGGYLDSGIIRSGDAWDEFHSMISDVNRSHYT